MKSTLPLAVLLGAMSACAPRLYVNVLQPAPVNFGAAKKISIVQTEGRRSAREAVIIELVNQARGAGYFTVTDRSEEGIVVRIAGRTVEVGGGRGPPQAPDEVGMRIDVNEWNANKDTQQTKDSKGNVVNKIIWVGRVVLSVTAFNASGKTFVTEKEYRGTYNHENSEDEAIAQSAERAVRALLEDFTPTYVQKAIRLDDEEEQQKPIIELARNGEVPRAIEEERGLVAKNANSAAAVYNLAVLLDSQGLYKEALPLYEEAIRLSPKDFYVENKSECARRLADAEALAN